MNFLKTTILNGLFVLLPLMLLWIGIKEIGGLLTEMATPIADLFQNRLGLLCHGAKLAAVATHVGHFVRNDQVVLTVHCALHVVAHHACAAAVH